MIPADFIPADLAEALKMESNHLNYQFSAALR